MRCPWRVRLYAIFMDGTFDQQEKLLRAVWPPNCRPDFWVNGRLSSAALKDKRGLSVDRTYDRSLEISVEFIKQHKHGYIVSFTIPNCNFVQACVKYLPSQENIYHCEIHGSETEKVLSDTQALLLARLAVLEFEPNAEYKV